MPEGSRRSSQRSQHSSGSRRPSSLTGVSSEQGCRGMSSSDRVQSRSSPGLVPVQSSGSVDSLSSSSVSLQDTAHSSSSSSLQNGSDISLDLTPIGTGGGAGVAMVTGQLSANQAAAGAGPKPLSRLERVALEIVETEQAYVRDLKSIVEDYLGCIIECGEVPLKPEQVSALFCNIEDIYEFNSDLLEDLERSPDAAAIADCFVERSEAFDIYTLYCMNYPNSVAVLRECMQDAVLVKFFHQRQSSLNHSLPLETYLLKPVQRILKYHLLLQELSKHLSKADPGYEVVEDAIVAMTAVAWYINDMKRKQEHAVRLQEIEALLVNWSGPDLSGFGELVLEGSFRVHRVKKERAFFLFDRMLLIAKKRLDHFVYSTHIFCCNLLLVETLKDPLSFKISDQSIPKQQHLVQTKNQEEKRLWVHYLKRLIVENHPATLPQKARQVLGDDFCQTPQFQQEALKSSSNPRLDDIHNFSRGRRPSEPQELMFTPEKSRKSLPLLLEGNLPFRRSRRQSAPAKDIEAAFHSSSLKSAESEGELSSCVDPLDSGSCSTLASSVIEVEPELNQDSANDQKNHNQSQQEPEDVELVTPPPSLSITEEILQLLSQSRQEETKAKENSPPVQKKHSRSNFTCPLPPIISPCSPEPLPTMPQDTVSTTIQESLPTTQQEQEEASKTQEEHDEEVLIENETVFKEQETVIEQTNQETVLEEVDGQNNQEITISEENSELEVLKTPQHEAAESVGSCVNENPIIQKRPCPTRGSQRRKRDKNIIEKIRSYYEAAAEAEEEDGEVTEEGENEGEEEKRRSSSVSQIPSGFVRESVTLFSSSKEEASKLADSIEIDKRDVDKQNGEEVCLEVSSDVFEERNEKQEESDQTMLAQNVETKQVNSGLGVCQSEAKESTICEDKEEQKNVKKTVSGPKVGRWSRHSRIVSANRALFEGMASDVERIGLFEASPVADPVLLENSQRILNKVQTLARMYSEKACHAKHAQQQQQRKNVFCQSWSQSGAKNRVRTQTESNKSPNRRPEQTTVQEETEERGQRPETDPLSAEDVRLSSSDSGLRSSAEPKSLDLNKETQSFLQSGDDWVHISPLSNEINNCCRKNPSLPLPAAKTAFQSDNIEVSARETQNNLLEESRSRQIRPKELPQNGASLPGHECLDLSLSGSLTQEEQNSELLKLSHRKDTLNIAPEMCVFDHSEKTNVSMGLQIQFPQEQVNDTTQSIEKTSREEMSSADLETSVEKRPGLTKGKAQNSAPYLQYQSQDAPIMGSGSPIKEYQVFRGELPQKPTPYMGNKNRNEIIDQPGSSTVAHPGFKEIQAQKEVSNLGYQNQDVSLSNPFEQLNSFEVGQTTFKEDQAQKEAPYLGYRSRDASLSNGSPTKEHQQFTEDLSQKSIPHLGFQSRDPPLMSYGSPIKEKQECTGDFFEKTASLKYQRKDVYFSNNKKPNTSMVGHPEVADTEALKEVSYLGYQSQDDEQSKTSIVVLQGFAETHAQKDASYHGYQSRDVSLSDSGASRVTASPFPNTFPVEKVSVQSPVWPKDSLPTVTDLRAADLHGAKSDARNIAAHEQHNTVACEQRDQSTVGSSHRPWSRQGVNSPALAALLPSPALSSTSAFRPSTSPVPSLPQNPPRPSNLPENQTYQDSPRPTHPPQDKTLQDLTRSISPSENWSHQELPRSTNSLENRTLQDLIRPANPLQNEIHQHLPRSINPPENQTQQDSHRSARPSPASAFTRSLAASCISQSISQSMSKKTQLTDKYSTPASLPSTYHLRQRSPSPKLSAEVNQHPKSFLWSPQSLANHPQRQNATPGHFHANANNNNNFASVHSSPNNDLNLANSHNRVARPFCTSEPNSRVQSPTSFSHDLISPLANKPPNPRRPGSTHNPLGLTLDINRASLMSCNSALSPRIMSPPPIGVSVNSWSNHIATPQPRNARFSPCQSPTLAYPNSLLNSQNTSPSPPFSTSLSRSRSITLADRPPSPAGSQSSALRRSWAENSRRSLTFSGPFDQQHESGFHSPHSGFSSPALACLSPTRSAIRSPVSPGQYSPARSSFSGQQFVGVPWSDEISRSLTSPHPQEIQNWRDSQLDEAVCRSQIICAYVSRPPRPSSYSNSFQNQSYAATLSTPASPTPSPIKAGSQRTSYATTVNLQIAGSGRIQSFSTAQVSLTQTLQNGAQPPGALMRRVSVHGLPQ